MPQTQPCAKPQNPFLHALDGRKTARKTAQPALSSRRAGQRRKGALLSYLGQALPGLLLGGVFVLFLCWPTTPKHPEPQPIARAIQPLPIKEAVISSGYGPRWGKMHQGVDFAAPVGAPIYATASGKVIHSGWETGYGKSIVLEHDSGLQTRYAHCSKLLVKLGERVIQGAKIAKVGSTGHSTGPHLHFEVIVDGEKRNPAWYYHLEPLQLASGKVEQVDNTPGQ